MKKIKFSVLMSVYKNDKPEYVKIAIDSLLNQTLIPNQIVIIADGPISKELEKLLKECQKNEIFNIYFRKENLGLGLTLNEGINYCKYDYIARMDADDESLPTRFEKQIKFLENYPEIDAVGCIIDEYDENMEKYICKRVVPETSEEINKFVKKRNPINHPTIVYKKTKVQSANSYEDYPYFEDYYLWAKMIKTNCKFYNIQESLYKFRAGSSMYKRRGGKKYLSSIKKFEKGLLELNLINKKEYKMNIIKRYIGALIPNKLRVILYKHLLRKN